MYLYTGYRGVPSMVALGILLGCIVRTNYVGDTPRVLKKINIRLLSFQKKVTLKHIHILITRPCNISALS